MISLLLGINVIFQLVMIGFSHQIQPYLYFSMIEFIYRIFISGFFLITYFITYNKVNLKNNLNLIHTLTWILVHSIGIHNIFDESIFEDTLLYPMSWLMVIAITFLFIRNYLSKNFTSKIIYPISFDISDDEDDSPIINNISSNSPIFDFSSDGKDKEDIDDDNLSQDTEDYFETKKSN